MKDFNVARPQKTAKAPQVSIGMPVYNGAKFINEALDSLLVQTFTDFELIISDNASTDETEAICRKYAAKDERIRYVRQVENFGGRANFQFLLDEAVGEYFMWAAADDVWLPEYIAACVDSLAGSTKASFAITGYKCVSRASGLLNRKFPHVHACIEIADPYERVRQFTSQSLSTHKDNLVYSLWCTKFIRSNIEKLKQLFPDRLPIGLVMNEYVLFTGIGCYIPRVLFLKRYRYVPPGHWAEPMVGLLAQAINKVRGKSQPKTADECINLQFLIDLERSMQAVGAQPEFIVEMLALNRSHLGLAMKSN